MPTYAFGCESCGHSYEHEQSIHAEHPTSCPRCGATGEEVFHQLWGTYKTLGLVKGSPTTVGQQAELNARRAGKEQIQMMAEEAALPKWTGPMPEGARVNTTGTGQPPWYRSGEVKGTGRLEKPLDLSKVKDVARYVATGDK